MRAPSLYTYFGSKNAIYDAMYADSARQLARTLADRAAGADAEETFRNRVRSFIAFCLADPLRYQLIFERPVPGFEPAPESFAITVRALAGTRADLQAAGVHRRARARPVPGADHRLDLAADRQRSRRRPVGPAARRRAGDLLLAHHLGPRPNSGRPARARRSGDDG